MTKNGLNWPQNRVFGLLVKFLSLVLYFNSVKSRYLWSGIDLWKLYAWKKSGSQIMAKNAQARWPATPENPEKPLKWLIPLERSLKYPENWDGPWKNILKSPQKSPFSPKWLLRWPYLQFWFLNFCLRRAIFITVYYFTHLIFPFSSVCVHPGKQSLSKDFKGTWKTINWHRNCPGGCQYQLLNCWYTSIRQWICVITY